MRRDISLTAGVQVLSRFDFDIERRDKILGSKAFLSFLCIRSSLLFLVERRFLVLVIWSGPKHGLHKVITFESGESRKYFCFDTP